MRASLAAAALVLLTSSPGLAVDPGMACQGRKLRATGKAGRALIGCAARGWDSSVPVRCDSAAGEKLERTFARADGGQCLTVGDGPEIRDRVESFASTVASSVPASQPRPSPCVGAKLAASAAKFLTVTTAHVRDKRRPDAARLATALGRAEAAFLAAYDAANALGDCVVSDELEKASESSRVDIWVTDFLRRLYPLCGDAVRAGTEECDGADATTCPDLCTAACTCPVCGNGVVEPGEQCDGSDDTLCPGLCAACDCLGSTCGDDVREPGEQCDGSTVGCEIYSGFAEICVPPGEPRECECCSVGICRMEHIVIPCCPGYVCVLTGSPHVGGICVGP